MKILVTGFEPVFARYDINPSWEAVKLLPDSIGGASLIKLELPCRYGSIRGVLEQALELHRPDVLLSVGHAGRTNGLELEWIGINRDDCSLSADRPLSEHAFELFLIQYDMISLRKDIHDIVSDIVARMLIFRARISQADNDDHFFILLLPKRQTAESPSGGGLPLGVA